MASFVVLTDSDILYPKSLSPDDYQLVYGIFYYTQMQSREVNLYNLTKSLCDTYSEYPLLLELKVEKWIERLEVIRKKIVQLQQDNAKSGMSTNFMFPFFRIGLGYPSDRLLQSIEIVGKLLKRMAKELANTPMKLFTNKSFTFPLKDRETFFIDFAKFYENKYLEWQEEWEKAEQNEELKKYYLDLYEGYSPEDVYCGLFGGILWELLREDYGKDYIYELEHTGFMMNLICTPENEWLYRDYFLNQKRANASGAEEIIQIETAQEMSTKKRTGVLLYMLESMGVKNREDARKIIHFALFHGHKKYNIKTDSNDTIYSYLHNDKQLFKIAGDIKTVLKEYDIPIPDGLEELDNRVFK